MIMINQNPESFVFYESFYEAIKELSKESARLRCLDAIIRYGLYGEVREDLSESERAILTLIMYQIDNAKSKRKKRQAAGRKGGKSNKQSKQGLSKQNDLQANGNDNDNENDNDNINGNVNGKENGNASSATAQSETKRAYGAQKNVYLSPSELSALQNDFKEDWQERIERLSAYKASSGRHYADDAATIRLWASRDRQAAKDKQYAGMDEAEIRDTREREAMLDEDLKAEMDKLWADADKAAAKRAAEAANAANADT